MPVGTVLAFWGVVVLLVIVPGPDWAFVLATGLRERVVLPAVIGLMTGYLIVTAVIAGGVGVLVAETPIVLTVLTVVGAGYLIWLGASLLVRPSRIRSDNVAVVRRSSARLLIKGIGVSALNPKGLLLFLAILPQFVEPDAVWPLTAQLALLGVVFVLTCGVFYTVLGFVARAVLSARPTASRVVSRISGGAMVVIGCWLLVERLWPML